MQKSKIDFKQVGQSLTIRFPAIQMGLARIEASVHMINGPRVVDLVRLLQRYNRFLLDADLLKIIGIVQDYERPVPQPQIVKARQERGQIRKELIEEIQKTRPEAVIIPDVPQIVQTSQGPKLENLPFVLPAGFMQAVKAWKEASQDIQPLINFMYNLAANPNPDARRDIFLWLQEKFMITPDGYIVGFRRAELKEKGLDNELIEYAQKAYAMVRLKKKSTDKFSIYKDTEGNHQYEWTDKIPVGTTILGTVKDLKEKPAQLSVYTDTYSRTTRIVVGEMVRDPAKAVSTSRDECNSGGLHIGSISYVKKGYHGQQLFMCLVNP